MPFSHISATGDVATVPTGGRHSVTRVILTPAAAVSTLVLRDGGSGGSVILSLQAAANGSSVVVDLGGHARRGNPGLALTGTLHATVGGAGTLAMIETV